MSPREGWYSRSDWLATFRPGDGLGHIVIAGGSEPPEDVAFSEICCDWCNADAGADREDGTEGRIYFTGGDSLCEPCGAKAEAHAKDRDRQELQQVRQTLRSRGWSEKDLADASDQDLREIGENWRVDRAAGISTADIAKNLDWDVADAVLFCGMVLEEVNEHRLAKVLFDSLDDDQPLDGRR